MFARLRLRATLRRADRSGVRRVCELVNRTNQWNLAGSRTTLREVGEWVASPDHTVLQVQVDDRFGPMGTVCVAVVRHHPEYLEIPVFVLSCRVFGFGIETLVLDRLRQLATRRLGTPRLRARLVPTEHNAPCRAMYAEHGYVPEGDDWIYVGRPDETPLPPWLTVVGGID